MENMPVCSSYSENVAGGFLVGFFWFLLCLFGVFVVTFCLVGFFLRCVCITTLLQWFYHLWSHFVIGS